MPQPIIDEFTHLDMTRQRKYALRRRRDGCCVTCGRPALTATKRARSDKRPMFFCAEHRRVRNVLQRELQRKYTGATKRLPGAESYRWSLELLEG